MEIISKLLASNLVLLAITFGCGLFIAAVAANDKRLATLKVLTAIIVISIIASFIFGVGEVYQYSDYYKRAFAIYGDDIGTTLILFGLLAIFFRSPLWYYAVLTGIAMTVGKASIILFFIALAALALINKQHRRLIAQRTLAGLFVAIALYFGAGVLGNLDITKEKGVAIVAAANKLPKPTDAAAKNVQVLNNAVREKPTAAKVYAAVRINKRSCPEFFSCFAIHAQNALHNRIISTIGGLHVTLQGGAPGMTGEAFAQKMMAENPWGINDRYKLTLDDWMRVGMPQNPYMHFGYGYGPYMLLALLLAWCMIAGMGMKNIAEGQRGIATAYAVFFITNLLVNQTQTYIAGYSSLLIAMGLAAGMILIHTWQRLYKPTGWADHSLNP